MNGDGTIGRDEYPVDDTSFAPASVVNTTLIAFASSKAHLKHNSNHNLKHHHQKGSHHGLQKGSTTILAKARMELTPTDGIPANLDWGVCIYSGISMGVSVLL